jgi:hypothetical protein
MKSNLACLAILIVVFAGSAQAQIEVEEAREAIRNGEYARAAFMLSTTVAQNPSADAYIYLGIAYAHLRDYRRAESTLQEGASKYPRDPRFHNELAGLYLSRNDVEKAQAALHTALEIDPENAYASDLLANIDLSQGNVRAALRAWAEKGGPIISRVLHDGRPLEDGAGHPVFRSAVAFEPGDALRYRQWRTTEKRLYESGLFTDVRLEMQPTPEAGRYYANIVTAYKKSTGFSRIDLLTQQLSWAFTRFLRFDRWDLLGSGVSFNAAYRTTSSRKRGEVRLLAPLPLPGGLVAEASGLWRSEDWNISRVTRAPATDASEFESAGWRVMLRAVPDYRFEVGVGFDFTNRRWSDGLPEPLANSRNSGKILFETSIRPVDGTYQNRLRVQAFLARKSLMGASDYSGGTVELNNRFPLAKVRDATIEWTVKAGTSRGSLPLDEYFVLAADINSPNLMRGHAAFRRGYGAAPMGTDFAVTNFTAEGTVQEFGNRGMFVFLPPLTVKAEAFVDSGKVFDRARVFKQDKLLVDAGAGIKIETPTHAIHVIYGHSLRDKNYFSGVYIEKRW